MKKFIPSTNALRKAESRLNKACRIEPFSQRSWRNSIPKKPGVYAIWPKRKNSKAVYIGESSNLYERLSDLGNPANHTFAKKVKTKISAKTTAGVKGHIKECFVLSFVTLTFGRAEVEEYLITHWETYVDEKYNDPTPRRWRCNA